MKDKKVIKKIVLIGDAGVGKTSIVRRFVTGLFNPAYIITLGTTIMKKEVEYIDTIVNLAIWDIGGQS
ncbi:MAG: ADP-ribosylation factor-like protein, partial [Candidatus Heimdallarchaeaceae archaeon]